MQSILEMIASAVNSVKEMAAVEYPHKIAEPDSIFEHKLVAPLLLLVGIVTGAIIFIGPISQTEMLKSKYVEVNRKLIASTAAQKEISEENFRLSGEAVLSEERLDRITAEARRLKEFPTMYVNCVMNVLEIEDINTQLHTQIKQKDDWIFAERSAKWRAKNKLANCPAQKKKK